MATKRRSTRSRNVPSKYFKESSSEEDEADDDKTKAAKQKLKQMVNEDSEAESDFEVEKEKDVDEDSDDQEEEDDEDEDGLDEDVEVKNQLSMKVSASETKSFCLSESDSSDDEASDSPPNSSKMINVKDNIFLRQTKDDPEKDSLESSQKLMALAGNLEKVNKVWQEMTEDKKLSPERNTKKRKSLDTSETVKKPRNLEIGDGVSDNIGRVDKRVNFSIRLG